jgi:hypothetical protein
MNEWLRGAVRHMKRIGDHPSHKELRARNEARLAALKAQRKLTEEKDETTNERPLTTGHRSPADWREYYSTCRADLGGSLTRATGQSGLVDGGG